MEEYEKSGMKESRVLPSAFRNRHQFAELSLIAPENGVCTVCECHERLLTDNGEDDDELRTAGVVYYPPIRTSPSGTLLVGVRDAVWHPSEMLLAVVMSSGHIHCFDVSRNEWRSDWTVQSEDDVRCILFHPHSPRLLAVACRRGVVIYRLGRRTEHLRTLTSSSSSTQYTCMSFHPTHSHLLASGSDTRNNVDVFDITTGECTSLHYPHSTRNVSFSPCGRRLLVTHKSCHMRVYEYPLCDGRQVWGSGLRSEVVCASWSSDGKVLFFGLEGEQEVHGLVENGDGKMEYGMCEHVDEVGVDVDRRGHPQVLLGGDVKGVVVDDTGRRLVVWFNGREPVLASYVVRTRPAVFLHPLGWIRVGTGEEEDDEVDGVVGWKGFEKGALFAAWRRRSGISFFPMYYTSTQN